MDHQSDFLASEKARITQEREKYAKDGLRMMKGLEKWYAPGTRTAINFARAEATDLGHEYIGTEHILLGVIREKGEGHKVLSQLLENVPIGKIVYGIYNLIKVGPERVTSEPLPTPRAKKVIEYSIEEMERFGFNQFDTDILVLGSLREQDGIAAQVLMSLNLRIEDVREYVLNPN